VDFQNRVDWKSIDKYAQANQLMRQRIYEGMTRYMSGGLKSLGSYHDRSKPLALYEATKEVVDRSYYLPQDKRRDLSSHARVSLGKTPGSGRHLLLGKNRLRTGATVRVNHVTLLPKCAGTIKLVVANKQVYASRYIRVASQLFYCVPDTQNPNKAGFFLIEMNDSRVPDFGSMKLSIVRKVAIGK
jgi:hypothetical protein